jgi:hypothetical protein
VPLIGYYPTGGTGQSDGWGSQAPCPLGSYCVNGVKTLCPTGQYAGTTTSSSCTPCPAGRHASEVGHSECVACAAGEDSYAGAVSCWPAIVAAFAVDGLFPPAPVLPGTSGLSVGDLVVVQFSSPAQAVPAFPVPVVFERRNEQGVFQTVSLGTVATEWNRPAQQLKLTITSVSTASDDTLLTGVAVHSSRRVVVCVCVRYDLQVPCAVRALTAVAVVGLPPCSYLRVSSFPWCRLLR